MVSRLSKTIRLGVMGVGLSWLLACAPVPVEEQWNPLDYTVKPGDTLYSISWRYELDYQELARWNDIGPPYAIYPGQRLRMSADDAGGSYGHDVVDVATDDSAEAMPATVEAIELPSEAEPVPVERDIRPDAVVVRAGDTLYSLARDYQIEPAQLARWNALKPPYALRVGQKLTLRPPGFAQAYKPPAPVVVRPVEKPAVRPVTRPVTKAGTASVAPAVFAWRWPVKGKVVKTFNANDTARKGIGIAGKIGQPVLAAAPGKVVYSGNGLISYGNLIIIKHSDEFLSAYAHNQDLLVKEGDDVSAGQTIANMGKEEGQVRLHFEIRRHGKPVNPLKYLPAG